MKKTIFFLVLAVSILGLGLVLPGQVKAQEGSGDVLAATTRKVPAPLPRIIGGQDVTFSETITQDVVAVGKNLILEGNVRGNLIVAGGMAKVGGNVTEDLIVVGGQVDLTGNVMKNVIVAGGRLKIEEGARVGGYLLGAGGKIAMLGKNDGDVRLFGGQVDIGGKSVFGGSLIVDASKITLADKAVVNGKKQLTEIKSNEKMPWGWIAKPQVKATFWGVSVVAELVGLLGKVILMLLFVRILGKHIPELLKQTVKNFWGVLGWGFLKMFLTPILVIFLLVTVVGIPLAMLVIGVYLFALFLAVYISSGILGHFLTTKGWLKNNNLYVQGVVGLLILEIVGWVPFVGWLVKLGAVLVGLGLIVEWEKALLRSKT